MQWHDWLAVVASIVSIAGIPIAIIRIIRTSEVVQAAERRLALYHILTLLPALAQIEHQLDVAAISGQQEPVIRALLDWKATANQVRGLLTANDATNEILPLLQRSVALASQTKMDVVAVGTADFLELTKAVRASVSEVTDNTGHLQAQLASRSTPGGC